ncbi:hypothetical protein MLD38_026552 [Melastoma candidum]|uniref:Uncharacterized protein n=1 Tax=Melastoma candidum TaxID=119954 RepID=A0ACB9NZV1_9MYRT|nr:hypothetical protein MLD38_026552 [Melastoma candidum]
MVANGTSDIVALTCDCYSHHGSMPLPPGLSNAGIAYRFVVGFNRESRKGWILQVSFYLRQKKRRRRPFGFSPAAASLPHEEDSKYRGAEVEDDKDDLEREAEESEAAWQQTLAAFKEQALKMQRVSQEAHDLYSKKAMVILRDTSEKLKIQAEKAQYDLSIAAKELGREGKQYLASAAENLPNSVKDIVEAFSSPTDDLSDISNFEIIQKRKFFSPVALKGQAVIAGIISLREIRLLLQRPSFRLDGGIS